MQNYPEDAEVTNGGFCHECGAPHFIPQNELKTEMTVEPGDHYQYWDMHGVRTVHYFPPEDDE